MIELFALALLVAQPEAQLFRLRGDALVLSRAPSGVIALGGDARPGDWVAAEAVIWAGVGADEAELDALVAAIELRHPDGWAELTAGRFIGGAALRPVHMDGGKGIARLPWGTSIEAFGGVPVGLRFTGRGGDWLAGGRVAQSVLGFGAIGLSVLNQSDQGSVAHREVGVDLAVHPLDWFDVSARATYDLIHSAPSELLLSGGVRFGPFRADLFAAHRTPSRILPATSVFSVLGDVPSTRAGAELSWRAAPRLDVSFLGGLREADGLGEELALRSTLRLDDRGRGALSLELRRDGTPGASWYGVRALARVPLAWRLTASAEAELVIPDGSDRGRLWPWGLIALGWSPFSGWEVAGAFEASATPELARAFDALFNVTYRWGDR